MYNSYTRSYNEQKKLTTSTGKVVDNDQNSLTTEKPAVTSLNDMNLLEKLSHFNRERIPERVVHAKGGGAYGKFTVTNDLTKYTCADFLSQVGKETEVFVRFSTVGGEKGSADTARDPRGFAVKLYTNDGNYDIVGNDTPVFFIRDAIKFPDFIHTQKRNPVTNLPDPDAFWDFFSLTPESMNQVTRLMSDYGTPDGFRHMDGFGTHTFMWYNNSRERYWIKYHFKTEQGIKNFTNDEAVELAGINPNYSVQDLYDSIKQGKYPAWTLFVQILTTEQAMNYKFNVFDVTKIIYEEDYPLIPVGRLVLNRLPKNFFNEVEQAAFCPGTIVPGVNLSPDKMLNARAISYTDAQRHRIGPNANQLSVNKPRCPVNNYQRDGDMSMLEQGAPNYYPNSFRGPEPNILVTPPSYEVEGMLARHPMKVEPIDFEQPRKLYNEFSAQEKEHLIYNISVSLKNALSNIQYRQTALFYITDVDYGTRVANKLGLNLDVVKTLATMSEEERNAKTMKK
ncbi:MAG: catalase [Clostridia bacterium]|jgi:catalase|nr:catalase [Clostridia bacterium]